MNLRRVLIAATGAALAVAGIASFTSWHARPEVLIDPPAAIAPAVSKVDVAAALKSIDATISSTRARAETPMGDMLDREALASAYLGRFRLTGDWNDLAEAGRQAEAGFAVTPGGHGPFLARAGVALAAHQLGKAQADLERVTGFVAPDRQTKSDSLAMRGDVALLRGDFVAAKRLYDEAGKIEKWPALYWRIGNLALLAGEFDRADQYYRAADGLNRNPTPSFRADSLVRQGELALAQGKWAEATRFFADADRVFPGWWRAQMRVAQMQALNGDAAGAIAAFEAVAVRTKVPEAMDILAGLYRNQGDAARARHWADEAGKIWEERLARLPEAALGHVVEHELASGSAQKALHYAQLNARNRPYPPSWILLAKAWIANGKPDQAMTWLDKAAAMAFVSADLWLTRAEALALKGDGSGVEAARKQAAGINPHALDRNPSFAWLDH